MEVQRGKIPVDRPLNKLIEWNCDVILVTKSRGLLIPYIGNIRKADSFVFIISTKKDRAFIIYLPSVLSPYLFLLFYTN